MTFDLGRCSIIVKILYLFYLSVPPWSPSRQSHKFTVMTRLKPKMLTDITRRITAANAEPCRMALRWILKSKELPAQARMLAMFKLAEMPRAASPLALRPQCVVTGRRKAVVKEYGVSRHVFREDALAGYIEGVQKAMW